MFLKRLPHNYRRVGLTLCVVRMWTWPKPMKRNISNTQQHSGSITQNGCVKGCDTVALCCSTIGYRGILGRLVKELFDLYGMIEEDAGTLEEDVYNQMYEIDR